MKGQSVRQSLCATNAARLSNQPNPYHFCAPQVESIEDADKRLDELAAQGRLNPALLLMMAKAHAAAKESSYTKEETKDVMAHLYFKARPLLDACKQP